MQYTSNINTVESHALGSSLPLVLAVPSSLAVCLLLVSLVYLESLRTGLLRKTVPSIY